MEEKVQISATQLTFLIITLVISTADIFLPNFIAHDAKKDSWISVVIATGVMFSISFLHLRLVRRYPGKTFMQICREAMGKVPGAIIGLTYVFYFLSITWSVSGEMGQVLNTAFMSLTPFWVFIALSTLVSAYAVFKDIEVIARVNEIFLPLGLMVLIFLVISNSREIDLKNFLPVLQEGILPPIRGGLTIMGYLGEMIIVMQLIPHVKHQERVSKAVYIGLLGAGVSILTGSLIYAFFGPVTEVFLMPALEFARYASIGIYIQNLDVFVMAIWITGIYIKMIIFYYVAAYSLAQVFRLESYKTMVIPMGLLIVSMALATGEKVVEGLGFHHYIYPLYTLTMTFFIPASLLLISTMKNRRKAKH